MSTAIASNFGSLCTNLPISERKRWKRLTSLAAKAIAWIEIAVAGALGIPFGFFYFLYILGRLFGEPRDGIGFIRGWFPIFTVFALALGFGGWALLRHGWKRWWGQLPWLFMVWFLWKFG